MIDIVIVNWNSGFFLRNCINSIFKNNSNELVASVYIIDNHSSDNSLEELMINEKIKIIKNNQNQGFSKACNQGFKLCTAQFVLLLNPDTQLHHDTLQKCVSFMQDNQSVDILGCQLLDDSGNISVSCARFPTPIQYLFNAFGLCKLFPKIFTPPALMTDWDHKKSRFVDQVMGAFMFMPNQVFVKNGYFDEQFFVYYEELDFSLRVINNGGKIFYNADIKAIHSGKGTTESVKSFRLYLNLTSRIKYAKKYFSYGGFLLVYISTFSVEFFSRLILLVLSGKVNEVGDLIKGYHLLLQRKNISYRNKLKN